ncbi:LysR family transcriptional regulator [Sneathiella sp. P13V-1]|uniref:LysR family transcriptional regulator n=1 Tax=Sneathiella sp. P13V-1 TaxID=2697366 RepID=UPI001D0FA886|nr:LysR family transcriptional regulator [Sneathiella sp. P13V-1]MBE7635317.1 LysR family transcriptional regulator [Sneathiella sp. P13V-1]
MRKISLDELSIFQTVAIEGGILRASEKLGRVPSNVTKRVKQLEDHLGVKLFRRQGRGIELTEEGRALLKYAGQILHLADEIEHEFRQEITGRILRLGALESAASVKLPPYLSEFHTRFPGATIELQTGTTDALLRLIDNNSIEAAFISEPFQAENVNSREVFEEELELIAPKGVLNLADVAALGRKTVVAFPQGCSYRKRLISWLQELQVIPERFMELGSYHAIVACVTAGTGISIVPKGVLDNAVSSTLIERFPMPAGFSRNKTHLVWRGEPSRSLKEFMGMLKVAS